MSLFAIADLHLSFGVNKPMDVFLGWNDYVSKIKKNWVIAGDVSWGMDLNQAFKDFAFLNSLPGQKILLKGNHDYYFSTKTKLDKFFYENGFNSLNFLYNNSFECGDFSICGTRGWVNMTDKNDFDEKILKREAGRLNLSLKSAKKTPLVARVFYGHLHGNACKCAVIGNFEGINYNLISSDYLNFNLLKIF